MCKLNNGDKFSRSKSMWAIDDKLIINELGPYWKQNAWVWILAVWLQVVMSVSRHFSTMSDLRWSLACFPTQILDGPQWSEGVYSIVTALVLYSYFAGPVHKEFESSPKIFTVGGPRWLGIRLFAALIRNTLCVWLFLPMYTRITQIYGDLHRQSINTRPLE